MFSAEAVRGELVGQMDDLVGREGAQAVQALLEGASKRQSGIFATIVGTITLLLAATGAFLELQAAFKSSTGRQTLVARCPYGRHRHGPALHRRQACNRVVSRSEFYCVFVRRGRFGDFAAVVGLLLVSDSPARRRVHAHLRRRGGRPSPTGNVRRA